MSRILIVCGLNREASLASGPDVVAVAGGGDAEALATRLEALDRSAFAAVVSFGLAGALAAELPAGALVLPTSVVSTEGVVLTTSAGLRERWSAQLRSAGLDADPRSLLGVDRPILSAGEKANLAARSGAVAVDMESHIAARYAASRGLPFGVIRAISDGAGHDLPELAGQAIRRDGSIDVPAVMRGLVRRPGDLPALLRTARDAGRAFRALGRARRLLGTDLGLGLRGVDL